jgi:GMP synthase (glutamine-hydrolysing)
VTDPEQKRKIIGEHFIRVFEEAARDVYAGAPGPKFLVQGTLYPDVIESAARTPRRRSRATTTSAACRRTSTSTWSSRCASLFKDEVRVIGEELGLPEAMVWRQPFPGPGLAVRIIGDITQERLDLVRAADRIVLEELRRAGLERELWQSFAALLTVRSVGVQGDERTYGHPIVLRAVTSEDAMTADWARIPYDVLERISNRVINEVGEGVNRVVLACDITSKPPAGTDDRVGVSSGSLSLTRVRSSSMRRMRRAPGCRGSAVEAMLSRLVVVRRAHRSESIAMRSALSSMPYRG